MRHGIISRRYRESVWSGSFIRDVSTQEGESNADDVDKEAGVCGMYCSRAVKLS